MQKRLSKNDSQEELEPESGTLSKSLSQEDARVEKEIATVFNSHIDDLVIGLNSGVGVGDFDENQDELAISVSSDEYLLLWKKTAQPTPDETEQKRLPRKSKN